MFNRFCDQSKKSIDFFTHIFFLLVVCATLVSSQTVTYYQTGEEFNGPFPSWKNVKTDYGAKGDGTTDDAAAITTAVRALKNTNAGSTFSVLYFPAGTYKIGSTVSNPDRSGDMYSSSAIIGEDPSNTVLVWSGASGKEMIDWSGWNIKISRLAFDGKGVAVDGIARVGGFGTGTEISDCFFSNFSNSGLRLSGPDAQGQSSQGQAEHLIIRCRFSKCVGYGIYCPSMNSLDEWIWYCLFEDCGFGIHPGGFQIYNSVFLRSTGADFGLSWQPVAFVNNISIGSGWNHGSLSGTTMQVSTGETFYQGNKIYNLSNPPYLRSNSVWLDNTVKASTAIYVQTGGAPCGVGFVGNTVSSTQLYTTNQASNLSVIQQENKTSATLSVPTTVELPATPPRVVRKIFEVLNADNIQTQIIAAYNEPDGSKPIVHIPKGNYSVRATIVVPGNREISIVGDGSGGYGTQISGASPNIRLMAPSRVTLQDVDFNGNPAMLVEVTDAPGSRVIGRLFNMQGMDAQRLANQAVIIDSIDHGDLLFCGAGIQRCLSGVLVRGGKDAATAADGQIAFLSGASSHALSLWDVQNNGKVIGHGFWKEADISSAGKHLLDLTPSSLGKIALGAMFWCDNMDMLANINGFNGYFTMLGSKFQRYNNPPQQIVITGDGTNCNALFGWVVDFAGTPNWSDNSSPAANAGLIVNGTSIWRKSNGTKPDSSTIHNQFSLMRSLHFDKPVACPAGVNDVKLLRVTACSNGGLGARFVGKPAGPIGVIGNHPNIYSGFGVKGTGEQILSMGKSVKIPTAATRLSVYSLQGRMIFNQSISNASDTRQAMDRLESVRKHGVTMVRFFE